MGKMFSRSSKRPVRSAGRANNAMIEPLEPRALLSTYYVSPFGSDLNAGTSLGAPLATVQHAADLARSGDKVDVLPGRYVGFALSGKSGIAFHGEPGATIVAAPAGGRDGIRIEGEEGAPISSITVDGFTVDNEAGNIARAGIRLAWANNSTIRFNRATNNGQWGIYASYTKNLSINANISSYNNANPVNNWNHHGIYVANSSSSPKVLNNIVYGNWGNGIHLNGDGTTGIGNGLITGALVSGNRVYDNGVNGGSAINCDGLQNSTIVGNVLNNNHAKGICLYQIDGAGASINNSVIRNKVVQAAGAQRAMNILDGSTGNRVEYDTLLGGAGSFNIDPQSRAGLVARYNVTSSPAGVKATARRSHVRSHARKTA